MIRKRKVLTDYKIQWLTQKDNGSYEGVIHVYEGDRTTENELRPGGVTVSVTRYRRTAFLREIPFTIPAGTTPAQIKTLLNNKLKEDSTRTPIPEQA